MPTELPLSVHLSICYAPHKMHPEVGGHGRAAGFPPSRVGHAGCCGSRSHGTNGSVPESWLWRSHMPQASQMAGEFLVPHPMSAAPHLSSWGAQEAPNSPQGCPQRGPPAPRRAGVAGRLPQWCRARQTGFMASGRKKLLGKRLSESIDRAAPLPPLCCLPFPHCTLNPILHPSPVGRGSPSPQGTQRGACSVGPSPQKGVRTSGGHRTQGTAL